MKISIWIFCDDYWHKWVDHEYKKVDVVQTIPSGCEGLNVLYNGGGWGDDWMYYIVEFIAHQILRIIVLKLTLNLFFSSWDTYKLKKMLLANKLFKELDIYEQKLA